MAVSALPKEASTGGVWTVDTAARDSNSTKKWRSANPHSAGNLRGLA